jgi:cell division protein FtsB
MSDPEPDTVGSRPRTGSAANGKKGKRAAAAEKKSIRPLAGTQGAPAVMAAIFVLAAVVVVTLVSYAQLVMVNDQVVELRDKLSDLKTEETKLTAQYELAYDLQEIESQMLASGQMTKVQSWQTYTLELSEPDSVEYYQGSDVRARLTAMADGLLTAVKEYFGPPVTYDQAETQ